MKVAFINSSFQEDVPSTTRNVIMAEEMQADNVECVFYTPIRKKNKTTIRHEGKNHITSIFVSCWVPFFSKHKEKFGRKSLTFLRLIDMLEFLVYVKRIRRRLSRDRIDAYVTLHLWDSTLPLVSSLLSRIRPVAVLCMDHSLRWLAQFKWQYPLILIALKTTLHKSLILIYDDAEQKYNVFKILKRSKENVHFFNPCIVNEQIFHPLNKYECARKIGFNTAINNIVTMSRIVSLGRIDTNKEWDYEKNVFLIVDVFHWAVRENPNIHLHILGDGPGMEELKTIIERYSLQDKITLYGWISATNDENDRRPYFINAADLFIFPHRLIEFNIGQALFEALMCAKPVIAFKRYDWLSTERLGGFFIDNDPKVAAKQILSRLNRDYLERKANEAKRIPYNHGVPISIWGKKLSEILKKFVSEYT